ncbi:MAG: ankyrin repeat domain-containing protein [bacterium]|nr:ankyrin repeat domain-containing protein [bacterium]
MQIRPVLGISNKQIKYQNAEYNNVSPSFTSKHVILDNSKAVSNILSKDKKFFGINFSNFFLDNNLTRKDRKMLKSLGYNIDKINAPIDKKWNTPLMIECQQQNLGAVKAICKIKGLDINAKNRSGYSALLNICSSLSCDAVFLDELLKVDGIDVNLKDNDGINALMLACWAGRDDMVERLLNRSDIDVNARDKLGRTALMFAIAGGNVKVIERLLNKDDIDINILDNDDETALMKLKDRVWMDNYDEILKLFENYNKKKYGRINTSEEAMLNQEDLRLFNANNITFDNINDVINGDAYKNKLFKEYWAKSNTMLHVVASVGYTNFTKALLKVKNVDINAQNYFGQVPLHLAAYYGRKGDVELLCKDIRTDIDIQDNDGCTSLITACYMGWEEIVEVLLKYGANPNIKDKDDNSPLFIVQCFIDEPSSIPYGLRNDIDPKSYERIANMLKEYKAVA